MSDFLTAAMADLAAEMELDAVATIALPSVIENAATKAGLTVEQMVATAAELPELRDYLASACNRPEVRDAVVGIVASGARSGEPLQ